MITVLIDYVEEIFQTLVESIGKEKIKNAIEEFNNVKPPSMNTTLTEQPRELPEKEWGGHATC